MKKEESEYNNMIGTDPDKEDLREHFEYLQSDQYDKDISIFGETFDNYDFFGPVRSEKEITERIKTVENLLNSEHPNKPALIEYLSSLKEAKQRFKNIN